MSQATTDEPDFEQATATASHALQLMAEHAVPATPQNFEVWFKFALGASPELSKIIHILIASKRGFDSATNRSLYQTYVCGDPDRETDHVELLVQLRTLLSTAREYLAASAADNRNPVAALGGVAAKIDRDPGPRPTTRRPVRELSKAVTPRPRWKPISPRRCRARQDPHAPRDRRGRSRTDALTGLANRHALDDFLRAAR